ncbi:EamA family transporter RarD [Oceanobacillus sp. CAU 1775]
MESREFKLGSLSTFSAYLIWGFLVIYWKWIDHIPAAEILAHRLIWSFVFMLILLVLLRQFSSFLKETRNLFREPKKLLLITAATILITINWYLFIWAVANEHVLQASLGYYINPLVSILLGIVILRESVTWKQGVAFVLAAIGVLYLTFQSGIFPWISIVLAVSFATYGLIKKKTNLSAVHSITIETMIIAPVAILYLVFLPEQSFQVTTPFVQDNLLLIGGGIATMVPLILFSMGAKVIPLSMVGILQFITPTLMLILGVFVYNEPFSKDNLIAFAFIWTALFLYLSTVYYRPAKQNKRLSERQ